MLILLEAVKDPEKIAAAKVASQIKGLALRCVHCSDSRNSSELI